MFLCLESGSQALFFNKKLPFEGPLSGTLVCGEFHEWRFYHAVPQIRFFRWDYVGIYKTLIGRSLNTLLAETLSQSQGAMLCFVLPVIIRTDEDPDHYTRITR